MSDETSAALFMQQIRFISDSIVELKTMVKNLDDRMRAVELSEAGCQALSQGQLSAAHRRLDDNQKLVDTLNSRLGAIEQKIPQIDEVLMIKNKLIIIVALSGFVGTAVGGLVITLIFDLAMGGGL